MKLAQDLQEASQLECHTDPVVLRDAKFIVVAVPTPADLAHQPDLSPLIKSSETVGKNLNVEPLWYMNHSLSWRDGRGVYTHS